MRGGKKEERIFVIDLIRFFLAIGILFHHYFGYFWVDPAGLGTKPRFRNGIVLVEIFLILSGYFTVRHFRKLKLKKTESTIDGRFKIAIEYTIKKFKAFLPYVLVALLVGIAYGLISDGFTAKNIVAQLEVFPQEMTLNSGYMNTFERLYHVPPLWYLSLSFIVFPVFCVFATFNKKPYLRNWLLFMALTIYYTTFWHGDFVGVEGIIRVLAGLLFGLLLYDFVEYFKTKKLKTWMRVGLQILEVLFVAYIGWKLTFRGDTLRPVTKTSDFFNIVLFSWFGLAFILSRQDFAHKINLRIAPLLGKLSLPIFLLHLPIENLIHYYLQDLIGFKWCLVFSVIISIIASAVVCFVVELIAKKVNDNIKVKKKNIKKSKEIR